MTIPLFNLQLSDFGRNRDSSETILESQRSILLKNYSVEQAQLELQTRCSSTPFYDSALLAIPDIDEILQALYDTDDMDTLNNRRKIIEIGCPQLSQEFIDRLTNPVFLSRSNRGFIEAQTNETGAFQSWMDVREFARMLVVVFCHDCSAPPSLDLLPRWSSLNAGDTSQHVDPQDSRSILEDFSRSRHLFIASRSPHCSATLLFVLSAIPHSSSYLFRIDTAYWLPSACAILRLLKRILFYISGDGRCSGELMSTVWREDLDSGLSFYILGLR